MKKLSLVLIFVALATALQAQDTRPEDMAIDKVKPLGELISLAITNAPALNAYSTSQDQTLEEIDVVKKNWLQHLSFTAGVNYGNGVMSDQLTNGTGTDNRVTYLTRQNVTYNVGLNIRLPFTEVASRKHEIKIKKLEVERLEYLKQDQQKLIEQEVTRRYKSLMFCLKAVAIQAEVVETNEVALKLAENYFKAAKLSMEQYRAAVDESYTAKLELEKSKSEAWFCFKSLKTIVGQSILK